MSASKTQPKTIAARLLAAQQAMTGIGRDARNQFGGSDGYVSYDKMLRECRAAFHAEGLICTASHTLIGESCVRSTYRLECGDSPEVREYVLDMPAVVSKGMPLDKAVAGAFSYSWRYFLRDVLMLPMQEATDPDAREDKTFDPELDAAARVLAAQCRALDAGRWRGMDDLNVARVVCKAKRRDMTTMNLLALADEAEAKVNGKAAAHG